MWNFWYFWYFWLLKNHWMKNLSGENESFALFLDESFQFWFTVWLVCASIPTHPSPFWLWIAAMIKSWLQTIYSSTTYWEIGFWMHNGIFCISLSLKIWHIWLLKYIKIKKLRVKDLGWFCFSHQENMHFNTQIVVFSKFISNYYDLFWIFSNIESLWQYKEMQNTLLWSDYITWSPGAKRSKIL